MWGLAINALVLVLLFPFCWLRSGGRWKLAKGWTTKDLSTAKYFARATWIAMAIATAGVAGGLHVLARSGYLAFLACCLASIAQEYLTNRRIRGEREMRTK